MDPVTEIVRCQDAAQVEAVLHDSVAPEEESAILRQVVVDGKLPRTTPKQVAKLTYLAYRSGHADLVEDLQMECDILLLENANEMKWPFLHAAAAGGNLALLRDLVETYPNQLEELDDGEKLPIHWAAAGGHHECVVLLMAHGSPRQVKARDAFGLRPVQAAFAAAGKGKTEVVRVLLVMMTQEQIAQPGSSGRLLIHDAALYTHNEAMVLLLQQGGALQMLVPDGDSDPADDSVDTAWSYLFASYVLSPHRSIDDLIQVIEAVAAAEQAEKHNEQILQDFTLFGKDFWDGEFGHNKANLQYDARVLSLLEYHGMIEKETMVDLFGDTVLQSIREERKRGIYTKRD